MSNSPTKEKVPEDANEHCPVSSLQRLVLSKKWMTNTVKSRDQRVNLLARMMLVKAVLINKYVPLHPRDPIQVILKKRVHPGQVVLI